MILIKHNEILGGSAALIELEGPLDGTTASDLEDYMNGLCDRGVIFIIVNAAGLKYISSSGIGVMLRVQKKVSGLNGYLVIYGLSSDIKTLYNILGLDSVLRIAENRIESVEIINKQIEMREGDQDEAAETGGDGGTLSSVYTPFIIECANCGSLIRVKMAGEFRCPECGVHFLADRDKNISWL